MAPAASTHTLRAADGVALHLVRWKAAPAAGGAPRGLVQIVHGLGEHIGRYGHVAVALAAAGWEVAGHDLRGHGRSEGARGGLPRPDAHLADVALVMDALGGGVAGGSAGESGSAGAAVPAGAPARHLLLGHSMGGLVAARFVAEGLAASPAPWARAVDALVLSSPALDPGMSAAQKLLLAVLGPLAPRLRINNGLDAAWISRDAGVVAAYRADPLVHDRVTPALARFIVDGGALVQSLAPRWRVPTLLMWAGADRCVAPAGSAAFAAAAPRELLTAREWPVCFHEIFNEPERGEVLAALVRWLERA